MHPALRIAALFVLAGLFGCGAGEEPAPLDPSPPGATEMDNLAYRGLFDTTGDDTGEVTLVDGRWEGEPFVPGSASRPTAGRAAGFHLTSDLDGDGGQEAVALLWASDGGSGNRIHLAVIGRQGADVVHRAAYLLGDRVQVRSGEVEGDVIRLRVVQSGPGDAACCPTETATRLFRLDEDRLLELPVEDTGTLLLMELAGPEWVLSELSPGEPAPAEPEITLSFDGEQLAGSSGCNRYFASVSPGDTPSELSVGPVAGTRMACPESAMDLESRFLSALEGANGFQFLAGELGLRWSREEESGLLTFRAREKD